MSGTAERTWRCFHCDEVFDNWGHARNHFGYTPADGAPVCKTERSTDSTVYHLKRRLESYQREDTALHRQIHQMEATHRAALIAEEEKGYARGLGDGRKPQRGATARQERRADLPAGGALMIAALLKRLRGPSPTRHETIEALISALVALIQRTRSLTDDYCAPPEVDHATKLIKRYRRQGVQP